MRRPLLMVLAAFVVVAAMGAPVIAAVIDVVAEHHADDDCASECAGDCPGEERPGEESCPSICSFSCCASIILPSVAADSSFVSMMPPSAAMTFVVLPEPLPAPHPAGVFHPPRRQA